MSLRSWRIARRKHAGEAFTGKGAREYGGRWNSPGVTMVYTAEHASLPILEVVVHLGGAQLLPDYVLFGVEFEEALVEAVDEVTLPKDWRGYPAPVSLRAFGDRWVVDLVRWRYPLFLRLVGENHPPRRARTRVVYSGRLEYEGER